MSVLVTGGAGYIGSHVVKLLLERGEKVVVVDDLVTGFSSRVAGLPFLELDLAAGDAVDRVVGFMAEHVVDSVIHFAARKQVGESVEQPARYFLDNLGGLANLLLGMERLGVERLVFSSSAAVYGEPDRTPVLETDVPEPINPYGETKWFGECLIRDARRAGKIRAISLRYFNVAGAADAERSDRVALNLIPMVIERVLAGRPPLIFGDDYATADGTCVRDYVHVVDLAEAHLVALEALRRGDQVSAEFNIGTGRGASVREVIDAVGRAAGKTLTPAVAPRRPGDPAALVADVSRVERELGWVAQRDLDDMAQSAWAGWLATH